MHLGNHSGLAKVTTLSGTASVAGVLSHQTCDGWMNWGSHCNLVSCYMQTAHCGFSFTVSEEQNQKERNQTQ